MTNQTLRRANYFTDPEARKYLLTCWIKTESNYGTGGKARWSATLDGDTKLAAEIEPTDGVWRYHHWRFDLPATNSAKELVLELTGVSGAAVLVDGIRFSPVKCDYLRNYYEKLHLELSDIEKLGGATVRSREAEDGSFSCEVMPEDRPLKLLANYQARQSGNFNPAAPNHSLSIYSCGWSNYQRFNSGELDGASWESDDMTRWTTAEAALVHTAGQENWILYKGAPAATRYAIAVSAKGEEIQHRLGLRWSDGSTLTWNPAAAKWSFTPSSGTAREWDAPARLKLDADKHAGDLDAGNVSDELRKDLAAEGLPLGEATVTAIESGQFWIINSGIILKGKAICYYLSRHGNKIWTLEAPRSWLAVVDGNRLAFLADGARIGTWEVSSALNPLVGVIATDAVSFRNFTIATDMAIELKFKNGAGQVVQEQAIGINEVIARAAFYDDRGNSEVHSLFARLTPGAEDMYKQIDNLATLDRSNYQMSGLVKDQNPNAGYFAYSRSKYEDSPLSRIVEQAGRERNWRSVTAIQPVAATVSMAASLD
ncbi:MAG: hypothetical protein GDA48_02340 [Hormoscilla sp. GM102CHS1]|nr:hypothetical protein [Hormoscilla sp. GM102CHS1]